MSGLLVERHKVLVKFDSPVRSYIRSLYPEAQQFVEQTGAEYGRMRMFSGHTTMGLILHETDEVKLLNDLVWLSKHIVPTDPRGRTVREGYIDSNEFPVDARWSHNCVDNPLLPEGEGDDDMNGDRHARALLLTQPEIGIDIEDSELVLGRFQRPAAFELDGGEEYSYRPLRKRRVIMTIDEYARKPKIYPSIEIPAYKQ